MAERLRAEAREATTMSPVCIELRSAYSKKTIAVDPDRAAGYSLGTDPSCDVVLGDPGVRAQHARIRTGGASLSLEPLAGAPVAVNGRPIEGAVGLSDGDWLALGPAVVQIRLDTEQAMSPVSHRSAATGEGSDGIKPAGATVFTIGRLASCDIEIASPLVSREHARLTCDVQGWQLEDLQSSNGTFVNGQRILKSTALQPGDRVEIATFAFLFTGAGLQLTDAEGRVRIEVRDLYKEVRDRSSGQPRRLLDQITLAIEPGEFVGIFGTSGSGKSTLLDALNGRRSASGGYVYYNNADLYACFDRFRATIGYVPQQDIVHRKISVRHALQYTARLRLPPDTSDAEIEAYIARVLERVGLAEKADLPIDTPAPLSGGQLKRVSLAVELVANPKILFLDEVTSGLDAGTDKRMMHLFRDLAADHKTVICVTHTLENIDACHLVVLLHRGRLVYFGPPQDVEAHFGIGRLSDVYDLLENAPVEHWVDRFRSSRHYQSYVAARLQGTGATHRQEGGPTVEDRARRRSLHWPQARTLTRRYLDLIFADRRNLLILLLQAPLIAVVIGLVFGSESALPKQAAMESQVSFMMVLSAIWFGCLNSARELVKELPIYLRERSVNLAIGPYLTSKILPLAALCLIQCALLLGIASGMVSLSGDFMERALTLFLAGMAATMLGLAVSAFVDSNDKAVAMVPILLIPQVILSDAVVRLGDLSLIVAKATTISYWGYDAMKASLGTDVLAARDPLGQVIVPVAGSYAGDLGMILVLGTALLVLAIVGLKLKDRRR